MGITQRAERLVPHTRPADAPAGRRAPLDGLRALAVLAVLAYHFGGGATSPVRGGFLGVDLFFVLSGYLITGLLLDEHRQTGGIDLLRFWGRRVRRLMPALTLVVVVVAAVLWWSAGPQGWPARRLDLLATVFHIANWHLIDTGQNYFAAYATASPVRHAWSLAIEEQFYLAWPLLLLAALRVRRGPALLAAAVTLASVVAMALLYDPDHAFRAYYGTDTRVHELAVGALLAVALRRGGPSAATAARLLPGALVLVVGAMLLLPDDAGLYYRGGSLVFAVVAAALVAGVERAPGSAPARALSWAPLAYLGLISYGVYLWHWPVMMLLPVPDQTALRLLCWSVVTLAASVLSFHLLERPVQRRGLPLAGLRPAPTLLVGGAVSLAAAGLVLAATHLPEPLRTEITQRADVDCPVRPGTPLTSCVLAQGRPDTPTTLVVGDSTARALTPGLIVRAERDGSTVVQAAWQMCTPSGLLVLRTEEQTPGRAAQLCARFAPSGIADAVARHRPDVVLVEDFWAHHQRLWVDGRVLEPGTPEHAAALADRYRLIVEQVAAAGGRTAFVQVPRPGTSIGPVVAAGRPAGTAQYAYPDTFLAGHNAMLREVAAGSPTAAVVEIEDLLCPGGRCDAVQDGHVMRPDGVHLTPQRSVELAPVVLARARQALGLPTGDLSR